MVSLKYAPERLRYHAMIGTGGIGSGSFFLLNGSQTLGREESRSGHFLDQRDYCKLHIISHYVKVLLGAGFPVYPIGRVGSDEIGARLTAEMQQIGLITQWVRVDREAPTLNAICILYPDGTGGNLTLDNSASDRVTPADIDQAADILEEYRGRGIAIAAPEVPLAMRKYLLAKATSYAFYRVASFVAGEMDEVRYDRILEQVDLIGLNLEEAASFVGGSAAEMGAEETVHRMVAAGQAQNPGLVISITAGKAGSWLWDGAALHFTPPVKVAVKSSAGAGDAHLAGLIAAAALGLDPQTSVCLATLVAGISVTSPHTIHPTLDRALIARFCQEGAWDVPETLRPLLED